MKAIIFDLDNTLIEWKDEFRCALRKVLKEFNYDFPESMIKRIDHAIDDSEKYNKVLTKEKLLNYINSICKTDFTKEFIDKLIIAQGNMLVYDDPSLIKVLEYLAKKYDLFVITNWFTDCQKMRLKNMGILKYFKEVYGADINYIKPDKKSFDIVLKNGSYDEYISIGDSLENDILLPLSLGMKVYWKSKVVDERYNTFKEMTDLLNIL